ncbi:MAG: 2-C-methyl-D-erythritol 4-phosphate cytidylyltransferase, partial [Beijerinckiaceae bacterium]|nr:2-C-methyl-D-erythritol 4-phosphate cytidylyltransferase [Beijerinckiaceae bacterium]
MSPLPPSDTAILLVAAGRGARAGQDRPKQHVRLAGRPLLSHALDAMAVLERPIQVVIAQGEDEVAEVEAPRRVAVDHHDGVAGPLVEVVHREGRPAEQVGPLEPVDGL